MLRYKVVLLVLGLLASAAHAANYKVKRLLPPWMRQGIEQAKSGGSFVKGNKSFTYHPPTDSGTAVKTTPKGVISGNITGSTEALVLANIFDEPHDFIVQQGTTRSALAQRNFHNIGDLFVLKVHGVDGVDTRAILKTPHQPDLFATYQDGRYVWRRKRDDRWQEIKRGLQPEALTSLDNLASKDTHWRNTGKDQQTARQKSLQKMMTSDDAWVDLGASWKLDDYYEWMLGLIEKREMRTAF